MLFCACVFSIGHVHLHGICAWHTIHTYIHTYPLYFSSKPSPPQRRSLISILEHWHQPQRGETNRVERKDISIRAWTT